MKETISNPREEAIARVTALSTAIQEFVASKRELSNIAVDALLSAYLTVANRTGCLHEVPPVLLKVVESIANNLLAAQSTKH